MADPIRNLGSDLAEDDRGMIKSLRKALAVLEEVGRAEIPPRIAEVAMAVGISRPTAYRIVRTLIAEGYLSLDPQSGRLAIGYSVLQQSARLLDGNRMRLEALPHLQHLANVSGERTNLGIIHQHRVLYLAGVEKPTLPTIYSRFGKTAPAHCCSLGKAILAHFSRQGRAYAASGAASVCPDQPIDRQQRQVHGGTRAVRQRGYATDLEEHMTQSFCVAATIFDGQNRAVGAIGISGRQFEPLLEHVPLLKHTAETISHVL